MRTSDELYNKISKQKLRQKPKYLFTLKSYFYWFLFICFTLMGGISFSIILFAIQEADFEIMNHLSHSFFEFILGIAPVIWLIFLILFLILAMIGIRNSKKGYKFSNSSIIGFSVSFSILIGTLFFISGGAQYLENAFAVNFTQYKSVEDLKISRWTNPAKGYLSGEIIEIDDDFLIIKDFNHNKWEVDISEAYVRGNSNWAVGTHLKFTGNANGDHVFKANEIRHWGRGGKGPRWKR